MRRSARLLVAATAALAGASCAAQGPLGALETPGAMEPAPGQSWLAYGNSLLALGEPRQAERAFTRSLSREGATAEALTGLGIAAAQQGLLNQARRHLEQAQALAPEDPEVNNKLGVVLFALGEYHEARQAFQTAFLTSSGRSELAAMNLRRSEDAIARMVPATPPDPAISHRVQRVGESEYRLLEIERGDAAGGNTSTGTPG